MPIQDEGLPEPSSSLSNVVPPKAIEMANAEVVKVKNKAPRGGRSVPYLILTPAQRYEVGKRAAEHGVTAALRYFTKKYPEMPLKETGIRGYVVNIFYSNFEWEICQIFFRQMCFCNEFAKFSHRQSFPPYGIHFNVHNSSGSGGMAPNPCFLLYQ